MRYNYGGNWTGLFCTGAEFQEPDALAFEHIYRLPHSYGYDGQFYHYIAHDPFLRRDLAAKVDAPRFRYRRILIPALAWALAAGNDRLIDAAYFTVILGAIFLAAFWTSRIAADCGLQPAWGGAVLLVPAVAISMDRMTVDVALIALLAGVVVYTRRGRWGIVWGLCVLACLVRESGMLIPAGILVWAALHRRFRIAGLMAIAPLPAFAWYGWLTQRTPRADIGLFSYIPFLGLFQRMATPFVYTFSPAVNFTATVLDYAALAGIAISVLYALAHARDLCRLPEGFIALAFVASVAAISHPEVWVEPHAFTRVFSPLILVVALHAMRTGSWVGALPLALVAPRIGMPIASQLGRALGSFLGL